MKVPIAVRGAVVASLMFAGVTNASAQEFGTFSWQLQPFCNVVTMTLTSVHGNFRLDGFDDQCGATKKAGVSGSGIFNPDGTVGLNFTIVASPNGSGGQVSAQVSPANGQGTWTDNAGNGGAFAFFAATPGLPPRPMPVSPTRRFSSYKAPSTPETTRTFDATPMSTYVIADPLITQAVLDAADLEVWLKIGSILAPLPYTSLAGGTTNTVWAQLELGQLRINRTTHGCLVAQCLVHLAQSLTFRYSLTSGAATVP